MTCLSLSGGSVVSLPLPASSRPLIDNEVDATLVEVFARSARVSSEKPTSTRSSSTFCNAASCSELSLLALSGAGMARGVPRPLPARPNKNQKHDEPTSRLGVEHRAHLHEIEVSRECRGGSFRRAPSSHALRLPLWGQEGKKKGRGRGRDFVAGSPVGQSVVAGSSTDGSAAPSPGLLVQTCSPPRGRGRNQDRRRSSPTHRRSGRG